MADYFEIDFLAVETKKSGDAISIRYEIGGQTYIHVVDGGYQSTGDKMAAHIKQYYGNPASINHVVVTHSDGDHTVGLRTVLEQFNVGALWMLRPWRYADELIDRFARFTSVDGLRARLKEIYPNLVALEEIAIEKGIPIYEPFQGTYIGAFTVLAPSKTRYLDLVVESDKTPEPAAEKSVASIFGDAARTLLEKAAAFVKAAWGEEVFSTEGTSAENEMSVIQYAYLSGKRIVLNGDAGRGGLIEAANFAQSIGLVLPGVDKFQVPHHGSRRNVSTEILDTWLGPKLASKPDHGTFEAMCSSAKEDEDHPRKSVRRAFVHRGAKFYATEGQSIQFRGGDVPDRGWPSATPMDYPDDQEE